MRVNVAAVLLSCLAPAAGAFQPPPPPNPERVYPLAVMWQGTPEGVPNDPNVTPMLSVDVHVTTEHPDPEDAAQFLAQKVLDNFTAGNVTA